MTPKAPTVKSLQRLVQRLQGELEGLKTEITSRQRELSMKTTQLIDIQTQLTTLVRPTKFQVSEHAIIRYYERVCGVNFHELEKEILSDQVLAMAQTFGGSGTFPNGEYHVVMKEGTVVTIILNR